MRNPMNRILLLTAAILLLFASTTPSLYARTFSDIVAFGDSLTDHNGLSDLIGDVPGFEDVPEAWTNCPPTGPCVWVEYMAAQWDAEVENYAIGGAMTEGHENADLETAVPIDLGLVGQVERYVALPLSFDPDDTLFSVWIGGNDLLEFLRGESGNISPETLVANAMENIRNALNDLESADAKYFLVLSLPDLSKSPSFSESDSSVKNQVQALVESFNTALETTVNIFAAANPDITVYRFNVFSFVNSLIADGTFENTTGTYTEDDGNADEYLFWDSIHPTTRAHELLGNAVADKIEDDDDDSSTCFISTAAGECTGASVMALIGVVFGLSATVLRRNP